MECPRVFQRLPCASTRFHVLLSRSVLFSHFPVVSAYPVYILYTTVSTSSLSSFYSCNTGFACLFTRTRAASLERSLSSISRLASLIAFSSLYVTRDHVQVSCSITSHVDLVIFTRSPISHVTPHVINFLSWNDPSSKSTFTSWPEIPDEPEIPERP